MEKGYSGGMPVQPFPNLYLKNTKLKRVNLPSFLNFYLAWME
jgi:hypothetical protein